MVCEHLAGLEQELITSGAVETSRGKPWSKNCREWVSFDVVFDTAAISNRIPFAPSVEVYENTDVRTGLEKGFVCSSCHDGIIGAIRGAKKFK
ncbi:MAG TPA: hypothetical protein PLP21_06165 [Pyrinomonadaceae bacterium]|nr:hypothetical protein [Pyrinomonadaceae bacterium]